MPVTGVIFAIIYILNINIGEVGLHTESDGMGTKLHMTRQSWFSIISRSRSVTGIMKLTVD